MMIELTESGRSRAESLMPRNQRDMVLKHLVAHGPTDLDELSVATNTPDHSIDGIVQGLIKDGLVRPSGGAVMPAPTGWT